MTTHILRLAFAAALAAVSYASAGPVKGPTSAAKPGRLSFPVTTKLGLALHHGLQGGGLASSLGQLDLSKKGAELSYAPLAEQLAVVAAEQPELFPTVARAHTVDSFAWLTPQQKSELLASSLPQMKQEVLDKVLAQAFAASQKTVEAKALELIAETDALKSQPRGIMETASGEMSQLLLAFPMYLSGRTVRNLEISHSYLGIFIAQSQSESLARRLGTTRDELIEVARNRSLTPNQEIGPAGLNPRSLGSPALNPEKNSARALFRPVDARWAAAITLALRKNPGPEQKDLVRPFILDLYGKDDLKALRAMNEFETLLPKINADGWPLTEVIKAHVAFAERAKNSADRERALARVESLALSGDASVKKRAIERLEAVEIRSGRLTKEGPRFLQVIAAIEKSQTGVWAQMADAKQGSDRFGVGPGALVTGVGLTLFFNSFNSGALWAFATGIVMALGGIFLILLGTARGRAALASEGVKAGLAARFGGPVFSFGLLLTAAALLFGRR